MTLGIVQQAAGCGWFGGSGLQYPTFDSYLWTAQGPQLLTGLPFRMCQLRLLRRDLRNRSTIVLKSPGVVLNPRVINHLVICGAEAVTATSLSDRGWQGRQRVGTILDY